MILTGSAMADQASRILGDTLALRFSLDYEVTEIPLRHGMKLGTDAKNVDIFIRPTGPMRRNYLTAAVRNNDGCLTLFSFDNRAPIVLPDGRDTMLLPLHDGTMFKIGVVHFECIVPAVELPNIKSNAPIDPEELLTRHSCPRCRETLVDCADANFCPHCGAPLPADCPAWPTLAPMPRKMLPTSRLRRLLSRFFNHDGVDDPVYSLRRTSVLAYINTLFNLGLRQEAAKNDEHNLDEAVRYYEKAASLGNLPARVRLALRKKHG